MKMKIALHLPEKHSDIHAHIELRKFLKPLNPALYKMLRGVSGTDKLFEIGCCNLDEPLEEPPRIGVMPRGVPETLKDLMAFPPVRKVVEVDSIEIPGILSPLFWWKCRRPELRLPV